MIEDKALETALTPIPLKLTPAAFGTSYTSNAGDGLETYSYRSTFGQQGAVSAKLPTPKKPQVTHTDKVTFVTDTSYVHYNGDTISRANIVVFS